VFNIYNALATAGFRLRRDMGELSVVPDSVIAPRM